MKTENFALSKIALAALLLEFMALGARGQESTPAETPAASVAEEMSPAPAPSITPAASPAATASAGRSVRISFLPPPLDGKISLGIYNENKELVRVLHQEAGLDEFVVGADALVTKWDGKNDDGEDLPSGKYSARGYVVAPIKIEEVKLDNPGQPPMAESVRLTLVANPLAGSNRPTVELKAGFDDENAFLKTADGLPLLTARPGGETKRAWIAQRPDRSLDLFLDDGSNVRQFHLVGAAKMMAFDCGDLELK